MPKIEIWFDNGKIKDAILGNDDYFIPDHTCRNEHDLLIIFTRLDAWVTTDDKKSQVSSAFYDCINDYLSAGNIADAMGLIRTYLIHQEFGGSDILDK